MIVALLNAMDGLTHLMAQTETGKMQNMDLINKN